MAADRPEVTPFGGITGRVVREALSFGSFLTGVVITGAFLLAAWWLDRMHAGSIGMPLFHFAMGFFLARFAVQGYTGYWKGSIFSSKGGDWWATNPVAFRYILLCALWVVPLLLLGVGKEKPSDLMGSLMMGTGSRTAVSLMALYITTVMLTPPVMLIAAVGADRVGDLFSASHWKRLFSGRWGEVFLIYAAYLGGVFMLLLLLLPLGVALGVQKPEAGLVFAALGTAAFAVGFSISLLGRLCGFFAAEAAGEDVARGVVAPRTPLVPTTPDPLTAALTARSRAGALLASGSPAMDEDLIAKPRTPSGKAPLLDARHRIDELMDRHGSNPAALVEYLDEMKEAYAPHPLILHALCLARHRAGLKDTALELAREALPMLLERGNIRLAADLYRLFLSDPDALSMRRDQLLAVADELREMNDPASAGVVLHRAILADPHDRVAVKKTLLLAEAQAKVHAWDDARATYEFLLEHCADSPLADHMRMGLAEAERRAGQERRTA